MNTVTLLMRDTCPGHELRFGCRMSSIRYTIALLSAFIHLFTMADCQLEFHVQQRPEGVYLLCSVGDDLKSTSMFYLDSLLIFRLETDARTIVASISSYHNNNSPVSHLPYAQVTGHLSEDAIFQRYLQIFWRHGEADLDGEYICDLHGIDTKYIPVTITQLLTVQLKHSCPCFEITPKVIQVGLTKELDMLCSLPDPTAVNISKLASLVIIKGIKHILAEINSATGFAVFKGSGALSGNGSIVGNNTFLQVVWKYPTAEMASEYVCEGSGVSISGDPVFFSKHINLSMEEPDPRELVQRLFEMYQMEKDYIRCQEGKDMLTNTHQPDASSQMTTEMPHTARTVTPSSKRCEELNLPIGEHAITLYPNDGQGPISVLCCVFEAGDIWTVFQKRFDGSVNFYRNFSEYKNGFGSVQSEFWLGLEKTRRLLLQNANNELRIDMKEVITNINYSRTYSSFSLGPGDGYRLIITNNVGDRGYGISANVGQNFSTYDHGYTMLANTNSRAAGWWFPLNGGYININGLWGTTNPYKAMFWFEFHMSWNHPMRETKMMFRQKNN